MWYIKFTYKYIWLNENVGWYCIYLKVYKINRTCLNPKDHVTPMIPYDTIQYYTD